MRSSERSSGAPDRERVLMHARIQQELIPCDPVRGSDGEGLHVRSYVPVRLQ